MVVGAGGGGTTTIRTLGHMLVGKGSHMFFWMLWSTIGVLDESLNFRDKQIVSFVLMWSLLFPDISFLRPDVECWLFFR